MSASFQPNPELYPFEPRWFDGAGPRVHHIDEGRGTPVLMLHGNPTWSFLYRKIVLALRGEFRCIAVDYPGFGLSERPPGYGYRPADHARVIGQLVDHLGLDEFIVVGQDWGGPIGLSIALERAPRVRGLVFANTWFWPVAGRMAGFSMFMSSPPLQWLILQRNFFVEFVMTHSGTKSLTVPVMDAYRGAQPYAAARVGVAVFPKELRRSRELLERLENEAPKAFAKTPVELVWGTRDIAFGRYADRWIRAFPHARLTRTEAGHYIQEDAPDLIAAAVRRVAAGQPGSEISGPDSSQA